MAAPELRLNVTLDLAFFRTQVQKLTAITQSEFTPRLNVKFNRQTLDAELNNLQRAIKRRVYRIEIGGNIDELPKKIQGIKEGLAALETQKKVEIPIGIKNGVTQKDATTVVAAMYRKIKESGLENTGGKIRVPVSIKPSITKKDVADFKKAVKDSLSGITVNVKANVQGGGFAGSAEGAAGLMEYMKKEGMIGKTASGMQMRMKNESNDKGRIQRSALDQLARAIFFMAGIDPSQIRAKRRQIPDVDWASTIPSRPPSIGPSSSGRALPFGAIPSSLPGTAFGSQKYLPTALGEELKQILRGAAYAFVDSFKQNIRTVKVTESPQSLLGGRVPAGLLPGRPSQTNVLELNNILAGAIREYFKAVARGVTAQAGGAFKPTKQSLLPGARVAGLLTPSVGRTPSRYSTAGETTQELFARREREARMRSALRSVDTLREGGVAGRAPSPYSTAYRGARSREAIVPYSAGGALVQSGGAPRPPSSGGRGSGFFGGMQFAMPKLPGAGIVQGLGTEFAFAAKQVLLFGTAYKALAFLTDFPSQVGAAVGQLQSFRNTLNAVSPSAQEAAQSSQFILDVVDKYNVPLQSARDGFTRLYASMQPAGFGGNEIRDLFLGISQAAATFGMSADKVDRVNYAFAQMASKGQVMSEELKGQLGDVLPGSMALFAEAAGFKGPQAITKFSKALEDGVYKGGAMKTLLTNVGIVMSKEFGPGAEGAAKTFQGSINRMQNSLKLFYETFEPVAVGFLNAVVTPMTSGIKTLTDGFNAFFTGQAAQTTSGNVLAQQLEQLRPAFDGIRNNITQILPLLQSFGKTALSLGSILLQIAGNPFVGYLARVYLAVLPLTIAIQALNLSALIPLIRNLLAAVPAFVAFTASQLRGMSTLGSFKAATYGLGLTAAETGVKIRLLSGIIKTAFATTVIGVALLGIGMLIEKLMMAGIKADEAKQKMLQFADSVKQAGKAGDVAGLTTTLAEEKGMAKRMQNAKALLEEIKKGKKSISEQQKQELEALGLTSNMAFFQEGGPKNLSKNLTVQVSMFGVLDANIQAAQKGYLEGQTKIIQSQKALNVAKTKQTEEEKKLEKIDLSGSDEDKKTSLETYYNLQDQLAKASTQADIDRINAIFEHRKSLINSAYDLEEARANSIQKEAIAHQKAVSSIFLELQKKQIDARLDVLKAQGSVAGGATATGGLTGGATGAGITQYISGDPSRADYRPDHGTIQNYHDHIAFATREIAIAAYKKLTAAGIKVTEFQGFGAGVTGPHSGPGSLHHKGLAMDIPGYQHGGSGPIGPKEYAGSARVRAILGIGGAGGGTAEAGAPRKVPGSEKRDILADQSVAIAQQRESLTLAHGQEEAQIALNIAKETYLAQIFGIAEKELQLGQLQKQTALLKAGATDQEIEDEMKLEEIRLKHTAGINEASKAIASNNALKAQGLIDQEELNKRNAYQNDLIDKFNKKLPESIKLQQRLNKEGREYAFTGRIKALTNEIQLLTTVGDAERRLLELRQGGLTPKEAQQVYSLEKVKKNLEDTKALIGNFVSSTSSDYKGFLKAVISGEDAVDALQKFQEGLTDKVLTIFLDFAMAPVEDMMKKSLEGLFMPKADTSKVQANVAVDANTTATTANTLAIEALTAAKGAGIVPGATPGAAPGQGVVPIEVIPFGSQSTLPAFDFSATDSIFGGLQDQIKASLDSVSLSFTDAAFNLNASAEPWKQTLITDIPFALSSSNEQLTTQGATFSEGLTNVVGGIGAAAAGITGIFAGISQIGKGGTSNVLGGIGSILMGAGGAIGGFGKIFGFADGGIPPMNKPSLVGERGPELFVPHSMGTIVPAGPTAGIREAMANGNGQSNASPVLNMSFESSTINGVEYVSRDQLEAAMMETRRQASRDGAKRGMTMTLDRLQQSPSTRSRIGLG